MLIFKTLRRVDKNVHRIECLIVERVYYVLHFFFQIIIHNQDLLLDITEEHKKKNEKHNVPNQK